MAASKLFGLLVHLARYFGVTIAGLVLDLGVYTALCALGVAPGFANLISSTCAVVLTYVLAARYVFGARRHPRTFVAYCAWYAISIIGFSFLVQVFHTQLDMAPLWAKLSTLPLSFVANYFAARFILRSGDPHAEEVR